MACVNVSGRLFPARILNLTDEDMSTLVSTEDPSLDGGWWWPNGSRDSLRSESIAGIICVDNPKEMLEPWMVNNDFTLLITSYAVTFFIGVLGNVTAMMGMIGDRKSRNATTLFLVSLSAADLLLLLVCAPLETLQYFVIHWDEAGTICKLIKYAEVLSAMASVLNLTAVSLERFIVIVFPIRSRSLCTMSNCRRAVMAVWIVSLLLTAPVLFTKDTSPLTFTDGLEEVTIYYCEDSGDGRIFAIYQGVILLAAPGLVMIVCYTYVIRELWISTRNMRVLTNTNTSNGNRCRSGSSRWLYQTGSTRSHAACLTPCHGPCAASNQSSPCKMYVSQTEHGSSRSNSTTTTTALTTGNGRDLTLLGSKANRQGNRRTRTVQNRRHQARAEDARKARKQVIKMLILVIVLFLICWGSRLMLEIFIKYGLDTYSQVEYSTRVAINLLPYIHSCINPFIYTLMSKNFRRSMWRRWQRITSLCCCCCFCCRCRQKLHRRCFCQTQSTSSQSASSPCHHCNNYQYSLHVLAAPQESHSVGYPLTPLGSPSANHIPLLRRHHSLYSSSQLPEATRHTDVEADSCFSAV